MSRCLRLPSELLIALFVLTFAAVVPHPALAQTTGSVDGVVVDITGAPVAGARVELTGGARPRTVVSDAAGRFVFEDVATGALRLRAIYAGFTPASADITVAAGRTTSTLTLGAPVSSEGVSVTGIAPVPTLDSRVSASSRLGLSIRETPATISVVTFEESQARGLATTTEAITRAPSVMAANVASTFATSMRGFTAQAVSTLFDGTRITTSTMVTRNFDSWNFERIEVLKGPASVLYGEGALAGAINFVAKRPDFTQRRGEALVSTGTFGDARGAVGYTGPIGDGARAAYRVDAVFNRTGGYIDDTDTTMANLSGAIDIRVSPKVDLSFSVDHFRDNYSTGYWGTPLISASIARDASDAVTDSRGLVLDRAIQDVSFEAADGHVKTNSTWLRSRFEWRLSSSWRLTNDAYWYDAARDWNAVDTFGFDSAASLVTRGVSGIEHDHGFYGNRLAVLADQRVLGRRNRLSFGVEVNHNDFFSPRRFGTGTSVDPFAPDRGTFPSEEPANFPGAGNAVDLTTTLNLVSVFVEDALTIAPRLTLVAGGRYDYFKMDRVAVDRNLAQETGFTRLFEPVSGRAGLVFDVAGRTQLFGQITSAVAPVSTVLVMSATNSRFELTSGRSVEGGIKSTLADGRVELTASVFDTKQDEILTRDPNNPNITIQGGTLASTGIEVSASVTPTTSLRVDGYASLMNARFEELIEAGGVDRAGNVPPNVPERSAGVWVTFQPRNGPVTIGAGIRGQGQFFGNNANTNKVAGYALVDAQVAWRVGRGDLTLRGKNLTDAFHVEWALTSTQMMIGAPRSIEAAYRFRF